MNVTDRGYSVKRSISVDVGAAASAQISSFTWLLGNKEALRLIVTNIIGKKKSPRLQYIIVKLSRLWSEQIFIYDLHLPHVRKSTWKNCGYESDASCCLGNTE